MTTTYPILRPGTAASTVSILKVPEAGMTLVGTERLSSGAMRSSYNVATGTDAAHPSFLRFTVANEKKDGVSYRRIDRLYDTWVQRYDDAALITSWPLWGKNSLYLPSEVPLSASQIVDMLETMFSFDYASVTASEMEQTRVTRAMLFGLTQVVP